jgi:hypothetical protein
MSRIPTASLLRPETRRSASPRHLRRAQPPITPTSSTAPGRGPRLVVKQGSEGGSRSIWPIRPARRSGNHPAARRIAGSRSRKTRAQSSSVQTSRSRHPTSSFKLVPASATSKRSSRSTPPLKSKPLRGTFISSRAAAARSAGDPDRPADDLAPDRRGSVHLFTAGRRDPAQDLRRGVPAGDEGTRQKAATYHIPEAVDCSRIPGIASFVLRTSKRDLISFAPPARVELNFPDCRPQTAAWWKARPPSPGE